MFTPQVTEIGFSVDFTNIFSVFTIGNLISLNSAGFFCKFTLFIDKFEPTSILISVPVPVPVPVFLTWYKFSSIRCKINT